MATKTINCYKDYSKKENSKLAFGHDYVSGLKPGKCILPFVNYDKAEFNGINIVSTEAYPSGYLKTVTYYRNSSKNSAKVLNFEDNKYYIGATDSKPSFEEFMKNISEFSKLLKNITIYPLAYDEFVKSYSLALESGDYVWNSKKEDVNEIYNDFCKTIYDNLENSIIEQIKNIIDESEGIDYDETYLLDYIKGEVLEVVKSHGTQYIVFKADKDQKIIQCDLDGENAKMEEFTENLFYCNGSDGGFKSADYDDIDAGRAQKEKIFEAYEKVVA